MKIKVATIEPNHWQMSFEVASGVLQLAVQRATAMVSIGLQGADAISPSHLEVPGASMQVSVTADNSPSPGHVRDEYRARVLSDGLRDCAEALGDALAAAYVECFLWSLPGPTIRLEAGNLRHQPATTGLQVQQMAADVEAFERFNLPTKVARLKALGLTQPEFYGDIRTISAARNVLAHSRGVVGGRGLVLTWVRIGLTAAGPAGESRPVGPGSRVEAGEIVAVSIDRVTRTFAAGDRITLRADDFSEIAITFLLYAQQLQQSILALQERRFAEQES